MKLHFMLAFGEGSIVINGGLLWELLVGRANIEVIRWILKVFRYCFLRFFLNFAESHQ